MTLEQATNNMTKALEAQDLAALEVALEARQAAIQRGATPTVEIVEAGARALRALERLKLGLVCDDARLGQVRRYLNR